MKRIIVGLTSLVIALASPSMAQAYAHANRFGGSTTHSVWGGTSHTNTWGGTTTGAYGVGAVHTTPYGTTAYRSAYHPPTGYYGYHPPVTAGSYHASCYYCGAAAGAAVGVAAGAAIGAASSSAAAANANAAAANASAAATNANVAAANAAVATAGVVAAYQMGAVYAALPAGCGTATVQGTTYYVCNDTWFSPAYGASGVYYRVVPAP